ncbi:Sorting nexin-41 [Smittium culicis]|uniref:Sorting nexin-41 n=1 Tax=Smittium culicis TaxID=133412 RepID=A0A1R1Y0L4_9FUNG|nr:Sorting nexin-41 [Smittium culicis]
MMSSMVKNLPKNPLFSSPSKSLGSSIPSEGMYSFPKISATNSIVSKVPIPSSLVPLANPEVRWVSCKLFTNKFNLIWKNEIETNTSKISKKIEENLENFSELGAIFNGLSLFEEGLYSKGIEITGQALDRMNIIMGEFVTRLEIGCVEVIHEYSRLSIAINQVLSYRNIKNIQLEQSITKLESKKNRLDALLKASEEYKRLELAHDDTPADSRAGNFNSNWKDQPIVPKLSKRENPLQSENFNSHQDQTRTSFDSKSNSNFYSQQLPSSNNRDHSRLNSIKNEFEDDPFAQFQMEQSIIWNDGAPSAIPQKSFEYGAYQNTNPKPILTPNHDELSGSTHFSSFDLQNSVSSPLDSRSNYAENLNQINNHPSRLSNDEEQSAPLESSADHQNELTSTNISATKSEPTIHDTQNQTISRFFKAPKSIGGSLLNKISIGFNGVSGPAEAEESRKQEINKLAEEISEIEDLTEILKDDLTLIDASTQENLDRFQKDKICDIRSILLSMANAHIQTNNKGIQEWERTLNVFHESEF